MENDPSCHPGLSCLREDMGCRLHPYRVLSESHTIYPAILILVNLLQKGSISRSLKQIYLNNSLRRHFAHDRYLGECLLLLSSATFVLVIR